MSQDIPNIPQCLNCENLMPPAKCKIYGDLPDEYLFNEKECEEYLPNPEIIT